MRFRSETTSSLIDFPLQTSFSPSPHLGEYSYNRQKHTSIKYVCVLDLPHRYQEKVFEKLMCRMHLHHDLIYQEMSSIIRTTTEVSSDKCSGPPFSSAFLAVVQ